MGKIVFSVCWLIACMAYINANAQKLKGTIKTTSNPNFVPAGDIIFYDDFRDCDTGHVPTNWEIKTFRSWKPLEKLVEGAAIKKINDIPVLRVPDGFFEYLSPLIKTTICDTCYLTLEFDYFHIIDSEKVTVHFNYYWGPAGWENACFAIDYNGKINIGYMHNKSSSSDQEMMYKLYDYIGKYDTSKWHHFAASFLQKKMTLYIDNYLIYKDVFLHLSPVAFIFMYPYYVTNIRIAQTQTNNKRYYSLDTILKGSKFVTHAIKFDVSQSIIKHECNGFIKQVAEWLQKNPTLRLEIDGHTDNDGTDATNIQLSVDRANAIKERLVLYGINELRLITKGFGASQPVDINTTPQGKANNRRVKFIKI